MPSERAHSSPHFLSAHNWRSPPKHLSHTEFGSYGGAAHRMVAQTARSNGGAGGGGDGSGGLAACGGRDGGGGEGGGGAEASAAVQYASPFVKQ